MTIIQTDHRTTALYDHRCARCGHLIPANTQRTLETLDTNGELTYLDWHPTCWRAEYGGDP